MKTEAEQHLEAVAWIKALVIAAKEKRDPRLLGCARYLVRELDKRCSVSWEGLDPFDFKLLNLEGLLSRTVGGCEVVFDASGNGPAYEVFSGAEAHIASFYVAWKDTPDAMIAELNRVKALAEGFASVGGAK